MSDYYREVSLNTVLIGRKYSRLSWDLVVDGAGWVCIATDKSRRRLFFRMVEEEMPGAVELKFYNGRKSPHFYSRPLLTQLGITQHHVVGLYAATSSSDDTVAVDLTERLSERGGRLKPSKTGPWRNPYQRDSAAFEAFRLGVRHNGVSLEEIREIAQRYGVKQQRLVSTVDEIRAQSHSRPERFHQDYVSTPIRSIWQSREPKISIGSRCQLSVRIEDGQIRLGLLATILHRDSGEVLCCTAVGRHRRQRARYPKFW